MDVLIAAIGRLKGGDARSPEAQLVARYQARADAMARQTGLRSVQILDRPEARAGSPAQRKAEEAGTLLQLSEGMTRIALDEGGRDLSSRQWADLVATARDDGARGLAFLIGGPDGHGEDLLAAADHTVSLGRATWPHLVVRALVAEQVYRALTILAGHPYHRD